MKTVGQILTQAIELHELNPQIVETEIGLPKGFLEQIMKDEFYTNSVPIILFKNLLLSLHIPFATIEPAMLSTFKVVQAKETPKTLKKKPHGYMLWENEEAVTKYTIRLKELMGNSKPKNHDKLEKRVAESKGLTPVTHRDYLLVEVPERLVTYQIFGNYITWYTDSATNSTISTQQLPPGNYSIVGLLSEVAEKDLTEDEWVQISEAVSKNNLTPDNCLILKKVL